MIVRIRGFAGTGAVIATALAAVVLIGGCSSGPKGSSGPVVLEMKGKQVTLEELRLQYDRANGFGSFAKATPQQKEEFLKTVGDKEILLATSREKTGGVTPEEEKALLPADDQRLLKGLEYSVLAPVRGDSATTKQMIAKLQRQILCDWLVTPSDSLTRLAKAEIAAGRPFAEVARRYSKADPKLVPDGRVDWTTGMQFGRDYMKELFVEDRAPGYLSEVRQTPRGYELFQVVDYRPYTPDKDRDAGFAPTMAQDIRFHDRFAFWSDSLKKARGLEVRQDAVDILRGGMTPYWDSLKASAEATQKRPSTFVPPISRFDAAQQKTPLYAFDGKETSIRGFLDGLAGMNPKMWPNDPDPATFRKQVESLALLQLELKVARERGIDRDPGYVLECQMDRERILLTKLQNEITKGQAPITADDVKAYYDSHKDTYTTKDRMMLSYFTFKTLPEAQRFYSQAMKKDSGWWADMCVTYPKEHPEVTVVSNSPEIDTNSPPAELAPIVERARNMKVSDIVEPLQTEKGWVVSRVAFNQHAGLLPIEKVETTVRRSISEDRLGEAMQKVIDEGRERYGQKLHPERLAPKA